jgi:uncharacterized protein
MLVFDLRTLAATAAHVDDAVAPDDPVWEAADRRPDTPLHVVGRVSVAGAGADRFYFSGRIRGGAADTCRRCLEDARVTVNEPVQLLFLADGAEGSDEPDVFRFDARSNDLDLRPGIREAWLLAAPAFALCRDDCKGLCPTCGIDRNVDHCTCAPVVDQRWAPLAVALRQSEG